MPWLVAGLALLAVLILMLPLKRWLERRAVLDRPNPRSSHAAPVPRGAGLVVVPVAVAAWVALNRGAGPDVVAASLALLLAAISWLDDLRGLGVVLRLTVQVAVVGSALALLPPDALVFQGALPLPADRAASFVLWLWFINLYNFMDGIDGLSGVATTTVGAGAALALAIGGRGDGLVFEALVLAAVAIGFLAWNRPPARIFLGDVGSIGLGFLVGWVLLRLAIDGFWAAALLLPLYHLGDATLTLALRLARGDRVWIAGRAHFYQRGAVALGGHAPVLGRILAAKLLLVALAAVTAAAPALAWPALAAGSLIVLAMLWYLAQAARRVGDAA
ncbi:glycosyl transferase [Desertibaculum subflavum]|uniref:glycosyl transferase n=1 Tax=Desertibaculum subflavum TaxID=2268458 RepID=UPI0013C496C7